MQRNFRHDERVNLSAKVDRIDVVSFKIAVHDSIKHLEAKRGNIEKGYRDKQADKIRNITYITYINEYPKTYITGCMAIKVAMGMKAVLGGSDVADQLVEKKKKKKSDKAKKESRQTLIKNVSSFVTYL